MLRRRVGFNLVQEKYMPVTFSPSGWLHVHSYTGRYISDCRSPSIDLFTVPSSDLNPVIRLDDFPSVPRIYECISGLCLQ
jgi:hypothetical protein